MLKGALAEFQMINNTVKQNITTASSRDYDEEKKLGISNTLPLYNDTQNSKKKEAYAVGVHKSKYTAKKEKILTSNANKNFLAHNKQFESMERYYEVTRNMYPENMCPSILGTTTNAPLIKELDMEMLSVKDIETMKIEFESGNEGRISAFSNRKFKYFPTENEEPTHSNDADAVQTQKERKCFQTMSVTNDAKNICSEKCLVKQTFNSEQTEVKKILSEAVRDINIENYNVQQYMCSSTSITKKGTHNMKSQPNTLYDREFMNPTLEYYPNQREKYDIKTLGDSLKYFNLSSYLLQIERSLEDVRRNKKSPDGHEIFFKQIDKEIQKLSFKYHPDKVTNRGSTEKEIAKAQKLQTAINATRNVLKFLNSAFLEDIGTEHKFGFYTKLDLSLLNNEDEIKYRIYEVIFKIGVISRIKQQNIISEIRKFLIASKNCVHSYLGAVNDFEKYRDLSLFHLKCCIKGFEKLCIELEKVKEQCESEKKSDNMSFLIHNMETDSKRDLKLLELLKTTAISSLSGKYQFFSSTEYMDPYLVLPLVSYTNVILMCNVMTRKSTVLDRLKKYFVPEPYYRDDLSYLMAPYFLASYYGGNKFHESTVLTMMDIMKFDQNGFKVKPSKEEIESEFYNHIQNNDEYMEFKFKIDDYNEVETSNLLMIDLKECLILMTEFQEKQEELSEGIKKFHKKTEKMDEKYERFGKMVEATEKLKQKIKERLEKSKTLSEKVFDALSDQ